jgi:hypothetical protein
VRRWDQSGVQTAPVTRTWTNLEAGIRVRFSALTFERVTTGRFRAGQVDDGHLAGRGPPQGIRHVLCPRALVTWDESGCGPLNLCTAIAGPS